MFCALWEIIEWYTETHKWRLINKKYKSLQFSTVDYIFNASENENNIIRNTVNINKLQQ